MSGHPWPDLAGRLTENGHTLPVRVYYEDTDFSGIVYHASYLRFMERGRSDFLRLLGIGHGALDSQGLAFAVRRMEIDFRQPARIDDVLEIVTKLAARGGASVTLAQTVARGGLPLVTAQVKVALVDAGGRPRRLPSQLVAKLSAQLPASRLS